MTRWTNCLRYQCRYYELEEKYELVCRLGSGKFSEVFKYKNKKTQQDIAMKKIDKEPLEAREKDFLRDEI